MNRERGLTVVVIPLAGTGSLQRCLLAIQRAPVTLIVVGRVQPREADSIRAMGATWIESDQPVPQRRAIGAAAARTEWIAFIEDTCEIGTAWHATYNTVCSQAASDAWGGPIDIDAGLPARCAALAAQEYGEYSHARWPRLATGPGALWRPVARLAGASLLYRAHALPSPVPAHGLIETEINERILAAGRMLALHPGLAVTYAVADRGSATWRSRFAHGRIYGGGQRLRSSPFARAAGIAKCMALPAVLVARGYAGLPGGHRHNPRTFGWLFCFALAWSAGEAVGLMFGRGSSLARWR